MIFLSIVSYIKALVTIDNLDKDPPNIEKQFPFILNLNSVLSMATLLVKAIIPQKKQTKRNTNNIKQLWLNRKIYNNKW